MKQIIYITFAALCMISCTQPNRIESAFRDYANVNFGDPRNYEITECVAKDSLYYEKFYKESMTEIENILVKYNMDDELKEFNNIKQQIKNSNIYIITYHLKVRIKHDSRAKVVTYYAYDYGDRIEIKEEKWEYDDLPKCYDDFFKFLFNLQ